jgi:alcohol dehydrogenase
MRTSSRTGFSRPWPADAHAACAIVASSTGAQSAERLSTRDLQPGEALVRFGRGVVDGLDLAAAAAGERHGAVLGRSAVGHVEKVGGAGVSPLARKRAVVSPIMACGGCERCGAGLAAQCLARRVHGFGGVDGCFADHFIVPAQNLIPAPEHVDDDTAAFASLVASALHASHQVPLHAKSFVTVLGDGRLGMILAQVLRRSVQTVRLVGRHPEKLSLAERWSVKHRLVDDIGRRGDQDVVFDCTGEPEGLGLAIELVRPRGVIVAKTILPGAGPALAPESIQSLVHNEVMLMGSGLGALGGNGLLREALEVLRRHEVDVVSLISRRMSLKDGSAAFRAAAQPGALGILLAP